MKSTETLLRQFDEQGLTYDERARCCCRVAAEFEYNGQYEDACHILTEWWAGVGHRPLLEGLTALTAAEILLRAGTLSGWFGSARQIEGAQDTAKDLISESITRFQALGDNIKTAAAQSDVGFCYWRVGSYDEARVYFNEALKSLASDNAELKAEILIRLAIVESSSGRYKDALRLLTNASQLFAESNHTLKGKFHNEVACALTFLRKSEHCQEHTDRAILEYTTAIYYFEQSSHTSYIARTENNLGFLLGNIGRYDEAHERLRRARRLFFSLKDIGGVAQVDETCARVLLAEGKPQIAAKVVGDAVRALYKGGEQAQLAEALTTQGYVLTRLNDFAASKNKFYQAANIAEQYGLLKEGGCALLALIEEHADWLAESELLEAYERADDLLKGTQDAETLARLRICARRVIAARQVAEAVKEKRSGVDFWADFSLAERAEAYEARYIRRALMEARGSVSRAARLLGFKHHASLVALLQGRHKSLAHLRTMPEKRRRSIIRVRSGRNLSKTLAGKSVRAAKILYAEDNRLVADGVKEQLEMEGWRVELVGDGDVALSRIKGKEAFDLLLLDNDLPHRSGMELARAARRLRHRRALPIIMLSASNVRTEAERAGVDVFLRKPEGVGELVGAIEHLLAAAGKKG
ncbi:MAG TPA: tetratricopeptide repeat protein [Pyrinomonadaceae bacterium]|jgi:CheY-like chemotaxis protein